MGRPLWQIGLSVLLLGATLGCTRSAVQQKPPPDPLLVTKKPVEGKPTSFKSEAAVRIDPPPPPYPARQYANGDMPAPVRPVQVGEPESPPRDISARPIAKTDTPDGRP
jgi:hypothetical protein